jgi:hypothetical protein
MTLTDILEELKSKLCENCYLSDDENCQEKAIAQAKSKIEEMCLPSEEELANIIGKVMGEIFNVTPKTDEPLATEGAKVIRWIMNNYVYGKLAKELYQEIRNRVKGNND